MKHLALALSLTIAVAGCGSSSNPNAPAPLPAEGSTSATTGAIHGTVTGATSASTASTTNGAGAGLTVIVDGTNIQATVNGAGQFTLSNVPAGAVVLRFNGVGANAQISIGTLNAGQTMTVSVVVDGDRAELTEKVQGSDKEIEGRIEAIEASTLKIAGRTVTVGATTIIRHGDTTMTLSQLAVGQRVHVKGTGSGTGTTASTAATLIIVQNMNTSIPMNLEGTVSGLTGTAAAFEFTVGGSTVKGNESTEFKGGKSPSFTGLANGGRVHVKGSMQNGFVQAESVVLQGKS